MPCISHLEIKIGEKNLSIRLKPKPYSDFTVVVGMKKRGKTTYTIGMVKSLLNIPFIAIDPAHQLGALGYCVHYPQRIAQNFRQLRRIVYQPIIPFYSDKNIKRDSEALMYNQAFYECRRFQYYLLIIDEVDEFAPSWGFPSPHCAELIKRGRSKGIGLICNSRRPHNINKAIRNNADYVICFQIVEDDDLKYISRWINKPKEQIKALPPYYYFLYDVEKGKTELCKPINITW